MSIEKFLLPYSSSSSVKHHLHLTKGLFVFSQMQSHRLESVILLVIGVFLDKIKTDTLKRWESCGIWALDGFQAELCLPSPLPPHDESWCTANCRSESHSGLLFSFISLYAGHVRRRVLIDQRAGLLNLVVVGQGDKCKVWPVPWCHLSLLS